MRRPAFFRARAAAKKHHPDVNPNDAAAGEVFKKMTSAYTEALLISTKRAKEAEQQASSSNTYRAPPRSPRNTQRGGREWNSPRAASGPVDEKRFNVREWDKAHYGLKGHTAEERQSEYIRNLYRQQQPRGGGSSFYGARSGARQRATPPHRHGAGSGTAIMALFVACGTVWTGVYQTNYGRYSGGRAW